MGFLGDSDGKESCLQCQRPGFNSWVRTIPWSREWLPTPVFLLEKPMDRGAQQITVHGVAELDTSKQLTQWERNMNGDTHTHTPHTHHTHHTVGVGGEEECSVNNNESRKYYQQNLYWKIKLFWNNAFSTSIFK